MVWVLYIIVAALIIYTIYAAGGDDEDPIADSLQDVQAPTAEQGRAIPVVFGTCLMKSANLVWYGDLKVVPVMEEP